MDPLTAFGLSANVFQVVNFSIDIVSHGYRIYKSSDGMLGEFSDIEKLATDLSNCNVLLLDYLHRVDPVQQSPPSLLRDDSDSTLVSEEQPPVKPSRFATTDEQALADLCRDCNRIADTLLSKLVKVKVKPGASKNEWKAAGKAFRIAWDKSEIESINSRLGQYREQLNTRLLFSVRERLERSAQHHDGQLETLEEKARNILASIMENHNEVTTDLSLLATRLSRLIIAENEKTRDLLNATLLQVSRASFVDSIPRPENHSWVSISRANTPSPSPVVSIHEAAKSGNLQQVRKILRNPRQNVDELNKAGCSALHLACINQRFDIAKYLLQKGAEVNLDDNTGSTPLHHAVKSGNAAFVRFLLLHHASRDFENDDGRKPFYYADKDNFLLNWIRKFGHNADAVDPATGLTALTEAAKQGDITSVKAMIVQGAIVDIQCPANKSALHYACESGHLDVINHLLENDCKLELQDKASRTPLMVATRSGHLSAVKLLVAAGADIEAKGEEEFTPLLAAIVDNHADVARFLISKDANMDAQDKYGYAPINRAGQAGRLEIVRALVDHGCSINKQKAGSGWSVISEAAWHGYPEVVDFLAGLGANIEIHEDRRETPLQKAAINGKTECVRRLLQYGANPNAQNFWDWTPLHEAAIQGHGEIVKLLLEAGAEPEKRISHEQDYTALHLASLKDNDECVQLLLKHGADVDAKSNQGSTSLMEACQHGGDDTVRILLEAGASIEIKDRNGSTALQKAVAEGKDDCVRLLKVHAAGT